MPRFLARIADWLESRWVAPAFAGWMLLVFTGCFLLAAINTMAGWLYVISGVSLALLLVAAVLPLRSLRGINIQRPLIPPVSAGNPLNLELTIANPTPNNKILLLIQDLVPASFRTTPQQVIESLPPQDTYTWRYQLETTRRGVYPWTKVSLRTAAPLGLFWCRRSRQVPAMAIVYPQVLTLQRCPLIDQLGQTHQQQRYSQSHQVRLATEGSTRSLRPYRRGDPLRMIHWRSSARYGELRVRELELASGGEDLVIALDCSPFWEADNFEQAVIASASLYCYARRYHPQVAFWTTMSGLVQSERSVLRTLAEVSFDATAQATLPQQPLIWLSQNPDSLKLLPAHSRWFLWSEPVDNDQAAAATIPSSGTGLIIQPHEPLQRQLQI